MQDGDLAVQGKIIGSWAGDRIVIGGDYADQGKFLPEKALGEILPPDTDMDVVNALGLDELENIPNLYHYALTQYRDISLKVAAALCAEPEVRNNWLENPSFRMRETLEKIKRLYIPDLEYPKLKEKG
jgi:hypothetical protein